ncbi:MAG: hypothetical protein KDJ50_01355 [Alphaproteobacteria bacterium]|nr:hypothetical protein [Alphaproteobacteria bacterium]
MDDKILAGKNCIQAWIEHLGLDDTTAASYLGISKAQFLATRKHPEMPFSCLTPEMVIRFCRNIKVHPAHLGSLVPDYWKTMPPYITAANILIANDVFNQYGSKDRALARYALDVEQQRFTRSFRNCEEFSVLSNELLELDAYDLTLIYNAASKQGSTPQSTLYQGVMMALDIACEDKFHAQNEEKTRKEAALDEISFCYADSFLRAVTLMGKLFVLPVEQEGQHQESQGIKKKKTMSGAINRIRNMTLFPRIPEPIKQPSASAEWAARKREEAQLVFEEKRLSRSRRASGQLQDFVRKSVQQLYYDDCLIEIRKFLSQMGRQDLACKVRLELVKDREALVESLFESFMACAEYQDAAKSLQDDIGRLEKAIEETGYFVKQEPRGYTIDRLHINRINTIRSLFANHLLIHMSEGRADRRQSQNTWSSKRPRSRPSPS